MFCVSKGLGAPIGSLVCGPAELMREARRMKILFGGAWRQAGVVAAAGLVALEEGPKRLHEDHERAGRLAEGIAEVLPGVVDPVDVETNMVFADTEAVGLDPLEAIGRLRNARASARPRSPARSGWSPTPTSGTRISRRRWRPGAAVVGGARTPATKEVAP